MRSGLQKYGSGCTKTTLSGNRCSADSLKTCAFGVQTLGTYQNSDPGHFGMTEVSGAEVSGHFGTRQYLHQIPNTLHMQRRICEYYITLKLY